MPHLFLRSPLDAEAIVTNFQQSRRELNGVHVAILRAYANKHTNSAVFEVVVEEDTIDQHTVLILSPRENSDEYIVQMTTIGHARPTYGMHRAVQAVGEWVASIHDDAHITETKIRS